MHRTLWRLVLGILLGIMVGVSLISTQTVFGLKEEVGLSSYQAGSIAGGMLEKVDWSVLIGSAVLLAALFLPAFRQANMRSRRIVIGGLVLLVVLELVELVFLTPRIHELRVEIMETFGTFEAADKEARGRFWMVHGISMIRALVQMVLAVGVFVAESDKLPPRSN